MDGRREGGREREEGCDSLKERKKDVNIGKEGWERER